MNNLFYSLIQSIKEKSGDFELLDVPMLIRELRETAGNQGDVLHPQFISRFIGKYLAWIKPSAVLDPYVHYGELIVEALKQPTVVRVEGWVRNSEVFEVLSEPNEKRSNLKSGTIAYTEESDGSQFDAIVSLLPFGFQAFGEEREFRKYGVSDYGDAVMLRACKQLSEDGRGLFFTNSAFMYAPHRASRWLEKQGLFVSAVLAIPAGSLSPYTNISSILVEIRRNPLGELFVGELSDQDQSQKALLENLMKRGQGKVPQLGALVSPEQFATFETFLAARNLDTLARKGRFRKIPVKQVVTEVNVPKRNSREPFPERPNAIYLPAIGTSNVVDRLDHATIKPQNLFQLVLNPEVTSAALFSRFLNTAFGRKVRGSFELGHIPRISKSRLEQGFLYLPETLEVEVDLVRLDTKITEAIGKLQRMQRDAWERPLTAGRLEKELDQLVRLKGQSLEEWIETLPFPLASILWSYRAEKNVKERATHLSHFFEAFAVFTTVIILSGFVKNKAFYQTLAKEFEEPNEAHHNWVHAASFGQWVTVGKRYAKALRRALSDVKQRESILRSFGEPERAFLDMLTHKEVFELLDLAKDWRNRWPGHGPYFNQEQYQSRLGELENLLVRLRNVIADAYQTVQFVNPKTCRYREGTFEYSVTVLMGTRTPFVEETIYTVEAMNDGVLHLVHQGKPYPVPVLPFISLGDNPRQQSRTAYFYNRLTDQGPRFVAYQFSDEPEAFIDSPEIREALALISKPDH